MKVFKFLGLLTLFSASVQADSLLSENFDNVGNLAGNGWAMINNSSPVGSTNWFQGNAGIFSSQAGADDSYIAANYLNASDLGGNISNWLITPNVTINNGDQLSFYTRSAGELPDRLEVRLSGNGASIDVGANDSSLGDFTTLLLSLNPTLSVGGFASDWTLQTYTFSGLGSPINGRLGFRYFISDTLSNGDYIGLDTLNLNSNSIPEPDILVYFGVGLAYFMRRRRLLSEQTTQL